MIRFTSLRLSVILLLAFGSRCCYGVTVEDLCSRFFPCHFNAGPFTKAAVWAQAGYSLHNLEDVAIFNEESGEHIGAATSEFICKALPLESPFLYLSKRSQRAPELLAMLPDISEGEELSYDGPLAPEAKALMQRDVFQVFTLIFNAASASKDSVLSEKGKRTLKAIAQLWPKLLFSSEELTSLRQNRPRRLPNGYVGEMNFNLHEDYLPSPVYGQKGDWYEVETEMMGLEHFRIFGGRSFVRVYWRAPGESKESLTRMWEDLNARYGARVHQALLKEVLPFRFESMLIRSISVFMRDGTVADSGIVEELLVRSFKYQEPRFDLLTSDFRGVVFYRYRLDRAELLRSPTSLGLLRTRDNDLQLSGFFGDAPDGNSVSQGVGTMRSNCISCHSELYYGIPTIFSFERTPRTRSKVSDSSIYLFNSSDNKCIPQMPAYLYLTKLLTEPM